jgi:L-lactate dehydrogenase
MMISKSTKLSIVGVGRVGSTIAFGVLMKGLAGEMVLVGHNAEKTEGDALDLMHCIPLACPMKITAGNYQDTTDSDIVIITASVPMEKDMESRTELLKNNYELFKEIIPKIAAASPGAILIVITNPVDVLTYAALKISGFPASRVMSTGTIVDSTRMRSFLAEERGINPREMHAYILGEHGDSQFPMASHVDIGGLVNLEKKEKAHIEDLFQKTKGAGFELFKKKGYTNYAVALAVMALIECIIRDLRIIYPVSTYLDGYFGVSDVCISVPAVIGRGGIIGLFEMDMNEREKKQLRESAQVVKNNMRSVGLIK